MPSIARGDASDFLIRYWEAVNRGNPSIRAEDLSSPYTLLHLYLYGGDHFITVEKLVDCVFDIQAQEHLTLV